MFCTLSLFGIPLDFDLGVKAIGVIVVKKRYPKGLGYHRYWIFSCIC